MGQSLPFRSFFFALVKKKIKISWQRKQGELLNWPLKVGTGLAGSKTEEIQVAGQV